jgi:hypothetical protein
MAYTHTRASNTFTAGESAPSAKEALNIDSLIVNQFGNIAVQGFQEDGVSVRLDATVEPPVLYLAEAATTALLGGVNPDGAFVRYGNEFDTRSVTVTGQYTWPGSEIRIV